MLFRYDFGKNKIDLENFIKQTPYYIDRIEDLEYDIYVQDYKMNVKFLLNKDVNFGFFLSFILLKRDEDGNIISSESIIPRHNVIFSDLKEISSLFEDYESKALLSFKDKKELVDCLCKFINMLRKLNYLKAFF